MRRNVLEMPNEPQFGDQLVSSDGHGGKAGNHLA